MITLLRKDWFDLWQDKARPLQVLMLVALEAAILNVQEKMA